MIKFLKLIKYILQPCVVIERLTTKRNRTFPLLKNLEIPIPIKVAKLLLIVKYLKETKKNTHDEHMIKISMMNKFFKPKHG